MNSRADTTLQIPPFIRRITSVWYRHFKVYTRNIYSNGIPPFLEPLLFLAGIGLGLGNYVGLIDGVTYITYLSAGILIPSAMYTASFECSFGTFIRLEFDKVYDGMLSSSLSIRDLFLGEILFAGTKGLFFSTAVLVVVSTFNLIPSGLAIFAPLVGFLTGCMFGSLSLYVTSYVKTINHFNFYFTGLLTPMFFFSGIVFPIKSLPETIRPLAQVFPLTHSVNLVRALCFNSFNSGLLWDVLYIFLFTGIFSYLAIGRLTKRIKG